MYEMLGYSHEICMCRSTEEEMALGRDIWKALCANQ